MQTEIKESLADYKQLLGEIKEKVRTAQLKAAVAVNRELIELYWQVGTSVLKKKEVEGWGSKTIERLAKDLSSSFPEMKGFSPRNIRFMVQFAKEYRDSEFMKQPVSQIPWGHNILLMQRLGDLETRIWYAHKTIENGWSRNVLCHWIDSQLHKKQGGALTNFGHTLPSLQSDLARETLKDPYSFDFLTLREKFDEKELEEGLVQHIQNFLLEMGAGFAFLGRQYKLNVGGEDFYLDMLFYHLKLKCYVVVELKANGFSPRDAGQMNFYLSVADDLLRQEGDNPTIGLLLCKTKNRIVAEYALRDINKPVGIAEYETRLIESLPENLRGSLPTIEEIEEELG